MLRPSTKQTVSIQLPVLHSQKVEAAQIQAHSRTISSIESWPELELRKYRVMRLGNRKQSFVAVSGVASSQDILQSFLYQLTQFTKYST